MTYLKYRDFGQFGTWAAHQLLPKPEWDAYLANECAADCPPEDPTCRPNATCAALEARFSDYVAAADPYALDFPVCADPSRAAGRRERHHVLRMAASIRGDAFRAYEPCSSNYAADYLNDAAVRAALHVEDAAPRWEECSDAVSSAYNFTDAAQPMMPVYVDIIRRTPRVKILVYSGDDDSVCATLGSQQWIWDLGFKVVDAWKPWLLDGQLGGYRVSFDGFEFKTIHGAGHMCPATQPARTFDVLRTFLSESP